MISQAENCGPRLTPLKFSNSSAKLHMKFMASFTMKENMRKLGNLRSNSMVYIKFPIRTGLDCSSLIGGLCPVVGRRYIGCDDAGF